MEPVSHVPAPVEEALEHLFELFGTAMPALSESALNKPALVEQALVKPALYLYKETPLTSLQRPILPTPARLEARHQIDVTLASDDDIYARLG